MTAGPEDPVEVIARSHLFDRGWYMSAYPDVAASRLSPAEHYVLFGPLLGRNPGPHFDTLAYLDKYPDVRAAGLNPLLHFERSGRKEGRITPLPKFSAVLPDHAVAASTIGERTWRMGPSEASGTMSGVMEAANRPVALKRVLPTFDTATARRYAMAADALHTDEMAGIKVSVIMPTYDRVALLESAIRSVLAQSHANLELLVIDDGSTDDTRTRLDAIDDPRMRVFWNDHAGVSAARNTGLHHATGEYVFYLDSDNVWTADHVRLTLSGLKWAGADCGYAGSCLVTEAGDLHGYRGEPFDWDECLSANYVDLNVFAHRIELFHQLGGFDTGLRRMVDWDLILRYTKNRRVVYLPFVGCLYLDHVSDTRRISVSEPFLFRRIVTEKIGQNLSSAVEALESASLSFGIKIPAPFERRDEWGDFHYAESLRDALCDLGHSARIDFHGEWATADTTGDDVALVLRGLDGFTPFRNQMNLMWNISHPDQVSYEEYAACSTVMVASRSYAALLSLILEKPVTALLQCTDTGRFHMPADTPPIEPGAKGLFVGNSRREFRQMVRWSIENDVEIDIYGTLWEDFIPPEKIAGRNLPNAALSDKYRAAGFVLNDHWQSMKDFGFVSNRVFDVLASGGRLVSDRLPALDAMFGDAVDAVADEAEFLHAVRTPPIPDHRRREAADHVARHHSFDARARAIVQMVKGALIPGPVDAGPAPDMGQEVRRKSVGLLLQRGWDWWTSSAFIRLIGPLTTDHAHSIVGLDLVALDGPDDPRLQDCDICIVQRIAVPDKGDAVRLIDDLRRRDVPLYVDTDDAFHLREEYQEADAALRLLMQAAREVWFSTSALADLYADCARISRVRRNDLDPRFWRDYRNPVKPEFEDGPIRFVYMGTATHHDDLQIVMPAFERLAKTHPGRFTLTLVGVTSTPPEADWLDCRRPAQRAGSYPAFARFLTRDVSFDVGIAPLAPSRFNAAKSDIKFLDYCAMGLLSVVSDNAVYRGAIDAELAVGCGPSATEWYETLAAIVDRPATYAEMRRRAAHHLWIERNVLRDPAPLADLLA